MKNLLELRVPGKRPRDLTKKLPRGQDLTSLENLSGGCPGEMVTLGLD